VAAPAASCSVTTMGPWMRTLTAVAALLLLASAPASAEESEDNALVQADAKDDDWDGLKKEILDSMPDDPEEESDDNEPDENSAWHITGDYPFLEYNGFLDEDLTRKGPSNLHTGKMNLTQAKEWCAENEKCAAFNHAGEPGEGPFEFFFKEYFLLSVETEDPWTTYQKGDKIEREPEVPEGNETDDEDSELSSEGGITAEQIMEEYGVDMEKFHAENRKYETTPDVGDETPQEL